MNRDAVAAMERAEEERLSSELLDEMTAEAQELGLYDAEPLVQITKEKP